MSSFWFAYLFGRWDCFTLVLQYFNLTYKEHLSLTLVQSWTQKKHCVTVEDWCFIPMRNEREAQKWCHTCADITWSNKDYVRYLKKQTGNLILKINYLKHSWMRELHSLFIHLCNNWHFGGELRFGILLQVIIDTWKTWKLEEVILLLITLQWIQFVYLYRFKNIICFRPFRFLWIWPCPFH